MIIKSENCRFLRRMGAILYDGLLLISVLLFATIPAVFFTGGEAVESGNMVLQIYLFLISLSYFIIPWKIKGQTLGMQSWKIKLVQDSGDPATWSQVIKRSLYAILSWIAVGAGFLWSLFDRERLAWHDRLSGTKLIHYRKDKT